MGTSGMFGGPRSGLVPSWVDEPASSPVALPDDAGGGTQDGGTDGDGGVVPTPAAPPSYPPIPTVPANSGLGVARGNLTRGARASDAGVIQRGAGKYVSACGGGRTAAHRMPKSRAVAGHVARFAHSFANQGPTATLRLYNLDSMAGKPAEDVFVALTDMLCPGRTIDEAIARDAMLETVADLAAAGVGSFDKLSAENLHEFFIGVVSRSIKGKILNEVGKGTVLIPADIAGVERIQNILHDFIERCVRDKFEAHETDLGDLDGNVIDRFVDDLYAETLNLMKVLGEGR